MGWEKTAEKGTQEQHLGKQVIFLALFNGRR